jgi:hypothetical protein
LSIESLRSHIAWAYDRHDDKDAKAMERELERMTAEIRSLRQQAHLLDPKTK